MCEVKCEKGMQRIAMSRRESEGLTNTETVGPRKSLPFCAVHAWWRRRRSTDKRDAGGTGRRDSVSTLFGTGRNGARCARDARDDDRDDR